ncbi:hypothetical protein WG628_15815 [Stenotrophomonas maltophilia]
MRTDATKYAHWVQVGLCIAIAIFILTAVLMIVAVIRDAFAGAALASSKDLISPLVASTGVLIAVLAYSRDRGKIEREREEAKSKIFAEQAKQSLQDAIELLEDRNQDRATWVRAARLILEAKKLGEAIPSADYKRVYELAAARVRHELNRVFIVKDEKTGLKAALPPAFFFGLSDWKTTKLTLNQMAISVSPATMVRSVSPERPLPETEGHGLSTHSVLAIFQFLQFPPEYDDPLDGLDHEGWHEWPDTFGASQGARRYLEHRSQYALIGKTLYDRSTRKKVEVQMPNISSGTLETMD